MSPNIFYFFLWSHLKVFLMYSHLNSWVVVESGQVLIVPLLSSTLGSSLHKSHTVGYGPSYRFACEKIPHHETKGDLSPIQQEKQDKIPKTLHPKNVSKEIMMKNEVSYQTEMKRKVIKIHKKITWRKILYN